MSTTKGGRRHHVNGRTNGKTAAAPVATLDPEPVVLPAPAATGDAGAPAAPAEAVGETASGVTAVTEGLAPTTAPAAPATPTTVATGELPDGTTGEGTTEGEGTGTLPEEKTPGTHAPQSERIRRYLVRSDDQLYGLASAPEPVATLLAAYRITPERVAGVRGQYDATQLTVSDRREAMAYEATAVRDLQRAYLVADAGYGAFRQVVRTIYPDPVRDLDAHRALGLDLPAPKSIPLFVDMGREAMRAAQSEPYATQLAAVGFDEEGIAGTLALFDAVDALYQARLAAGHAAVEATKVRNAAVDGLRVAMRQLQAEVKAMLRAHPEVSAPSGF